MVEKRDAECGGNRVSEAAARSLVAAVSDRPLHWNLKQKDQKI